MKNRWYDKHEETLKALEALKNLDKTSRCQIAQEIIEISNQIKNIKRENTKEDTPLSLGLERVLGLYQTANKRRWYDKDDELSNALKNISTLPEEDFLNIMQGLFELLNE